VTVAKKNDGRVKGWTHLSSCGRWLFVRLRVMGGLYLRTHPCVAAVGCPACGAKREEPCRGTRGPMTDTHFKRRHLASGRGPT
jgi:hypothetical protein